MIDPREGESVSFLLFDVQASGLRDTDQAQQQLRAAMYSIVNGAFERSDIDRDEVYWEDRGDGVIYVTPSHHTERLLFPFLEYLQFYLGEYNANNPQGLWIRLRVALHIGTFHSDDQGFYGAEANHVFRIANAREVKKILADSPASLVSMLSSDVYKRIREFSCPPIDATDYSPLTITNKETKAMAWARLRGHLPSAVLHIDTTGDELAPPGSNGNSGSKYDIRTNNNQGEIIGDQGIQINTFQANQKS